MDSVAAMPSATSGIISPPMPSAVLENALDDVPAHHANAVVAFMIGLGILNLTSDSFSLSQLIGSTLALEYMRAEYVAPLGSTSLIFNFLFAKFLVNSPVTNHDIYGTIIVIIGVIGIVAFGSINSGLTTETDAHHLTYLWTRGNWLGFFFFMAFSLISLSIFTSQLDAVLAARADLSAVPFSSMTSRPTAPASRSLFGKVGAAWHGMMLTIRGYLEAWTAAHDDKRIAWTLGIGWACCGGGLAGGCLVFAKAAVQLISGSLSHENTGNQFGHASSIFTFILLAVTAVSQIIFNNEVDAYESWALFLIFCSILVLVSGVVLLTNKKPDQHGRTAASGTSTNATLVNLPRLRRRHTGTKGDKPGMIGDEEEGLRVSEDGETTAADGAVLWQLGEVSDEEDADEPGFPHSPRRGEGVGVTGGEGERARMMEDHEPEHEEDHRASVSSDATLARPEGDGGAYADDEFGDWGEAKTPS
ncbi:hypothetical protein PHLCEN_2v3687 [Hermanssonia centrifuga]|uniref:Uncharacterized protein n=1 Tax=Hermanssonia centrifuga TaxID=98765 RepID=A0A2R6QEG9_9APHY|nr:hypothetical protein PHLCEN_2v3687 [Hermanssonia centrifuga]